MCYIVSLEHKATGKSSESLKLARVCSKMGPSFGGRWLALALNRFLGGVAPSWPRSAASSLLSLQSCQSFEARRCSGQVFPYV